MAVFRPSGQLRYATSTIHSFDEGHLARYASIQAQQRGGTGSKVGPVSSGANPYRVIRDWASLSAEGRPWGEPNVAIERDGKSVWVTDRRSPGTTPGCLGTKANPVHHFFDSGKRIRSFGDGMYVWPHGIHREGKCVTDVRASGTDHLKNFPGETSREALSSRGPGPASDLDDIVKQIRSHTNSGSQQLLGKLGPDTCSGKTADYPALRIQAALFEDENILQCYDIAFHPCDFGQINHAARTVAHARDLHQ